MNRLTTLLMAAALSVSCVIVPAAASPISENTDQILTLEAQPREILRAKETHNVHVGTRIAAVTINYTVRYEASNSSGKYITGVLNGSIENVSGWTDVRNLSIDPYGVIYSKNHQVATVPITYQASIGEGYATYTDTFTIDLT